MTELELSSLAKPNSISFSKNGSFGLKETPKRKKTTKKQKISQEKEKRANEVREAEAAPGATEDYLNLTPVKIKQYFPEKPHIEKVGNLTIEFSDSHPEFDTTRFRDSDRKAQAQRILKHSGMTDFRVKPKTFLQVVSESCREHYENVISGIKGNDSDIKKQAPYSKYITTLIRSFLNTLFGVEAAATSKDSEKVRYYMNGMKKHPQLEKSLLNDFIRYTNDAHNWDDFCTLVTKIPINSQEKLCYIAGDIAKKWFSRTKFNKTKYSPIIETRGNVKIGKRTSNRPIVNLSDRKGSPELPGNN